VEPHVVRAAERGELNLGRRIGGKIALPVGSVAPLADAKGASANSAVSPSSMSALRLRTAVGESIFKA
jgi:hypothetical protein